MTLQYQANITAEQALENAIYQYRQLAQKIKDMEMEQAIQKQIVADIFVELNIDRAATQAGKALITAPSRIVSYDWKALDALCASNPALAKVLQPHRTEKQRPGTLTIKE